MMLLLMMIKKKKTIRPPANVTQFHFTCINTDTHTLHVSLDLENDFLVPYKIYVYAKIWYIENVEYGLK